ncbi:MAG: hypothetical protein ACR2H3_04555 [Acidimicrobiales bacterium]
MDDLSEAPAKSADPRVTAPSIEPEAQPDQDGPNTPPLSPAKRAATAVAVVAFFLAATVAAVGIRPVTECSTTIFGGPGDATAGMIWLQWNYEELNAAPLKGHTPLINAPDGGDLWRPIFVTSGVVMLPTWVATQVVGPVCSWNLAVISGFVLSGLAMFGLATWLTGHRGAALVAGYAYAFSPFAVRKAEGHVDYVHLWVFPLIIWALLAAWRRPTRRSALIAGGAIALAGYIDGYYLLTATVMAGALVVGGIITKFRTASRAELARYVRLSLLSAVVAGACLLPIGFVLATSSSEVSSSVERTLGDVNIYSARPWEFVLPARTHPVFSNYFGSWQDRHLHESNYVEQTLYVGLTVIALAGVTVVAAARRHRPRSLAVPIRQLAIILGTGVVVAGLFSAPPKVDAGFVDLSFPSGLVYSVIPFWRVFARFFIPLHAALVPLAAVGVALLAGRSRLRSITVVTAALLVVSFDLLAVPPRPTWSYATETPSVYRWVAAEDDSGIVANYPLVDPPLSPHLTYLTYQRIFDRPMLNGAETGTRSWQLTAALIGLNDPQTLPVLRRLGVTTVILHPSLYGQALEAGPPAPPGLIERFRGEFGTAYDIAPGPSAVAALTIGDGFLFGESEGFASQRWMGTEATLGLRRFGRTKPPLEVSFEAVSFAEPRRLTITQDGQTIWRGEISSDRRTKVTFRTTSTSTLRLQASPEAVPIGSVLKATGDGRIVSINLSMLSVEALPS